MADIDFVTDLTGSFAVSLGDNPQKITGNRALLNRFEIVFLTKTRRFLQGQDIIVDRFGGDAQKFVNKPQVLNDIQGISTSLAIAVDQTVQSIKGDFDELVPDTEKLDSAEIISVDIVDEIVYATIQIFPVEVESYDVLKLNLPIIRL